MDKLKKERRVSRILFTKAADKLEQLLSSSEYSFTELTAAYDFTLKKAETLSSVEDKVRELLLADDDVTDEVMVVESEAAEQYEFRWVTMKVRYENCITKLNGKNTYLKSDSSTENICNESQKSITNVSVSEISTNSIRQSGNHLDSKYDYSHRYNRKFSLPKIELRKFDGQIKNWLPFWGQFRKIDQDSSIDNDDKYQYLVQATAPGTCARELVESFPPSGTNYIKAVQLLKNRFARDELLIEYYVRELLNLILYQSKQKVLDLCSLYDKLTAQLQSLDTLGVTSDKYAAMLFPLVESAIPEDVLRTWERMRTPGESKQLSQLLEFIGREVASEERIKISKTGFTDNFSNVQQPTMSCIFSGAKKHNSGNSSDEIIKERLCIWCDKATHSSTECFKGGKMTLDERRELIRKKNGCVICLKIGHPAKKCKLFPKCFNCSKRHNIVMCPNLNCDSSKTNDIISNDPNVLLTQNNTTLLQTLLVQIQNIKNNKKVTVRALFDSGSQRSYVRDSVVSSLGLISVGHESLSHNLFGGLKTSIQTHNKYEFLVNSLDSSYGLKMIALHKDKICGALPYIKETFLNNFIKHHNIILSDATNNNSSDIELLIGSDYLGTIMTNILVELGNNLVAIKSKLGWTIQGPILKHNVDTSLFNLVTVNNIFCFDDSDLSNFWNLECLGIKDLAQSKSQKKVEEEFLEHFEQNIRINEENRYEVRLPWKEDRPEIKNNFELAKKRLYTTTKKLMSLNKLNEYNKVFKEWMSLNIIEIAPDPNDYNGHFLAHHPVFKYDSLTTKLRPVFDGSASDCNGVSINKCLEKGQNLLELIPKLIIDFRSRSIGITADIKKAFLQISLYEDNREFFKYLWWNNPETRDHLVVYRHRRVVFGITSSPFLLAATLKYHLEKMCTQYLKATSCKLLSSFYVDNCATSVDSKDDMQNFINQSKSLMQSGGFELRGWVTSPVKVDTITKEVSVLGIIWHVDTDELSCNTKMLNIDLKKKFLKRIFDPIGFSAPAVLLPRIVIQKCWSKQIKWDEEIPTDLQLEFKNWFKHINYLKDCRIPRTLSHICIKDCNISIHVFSDACKYAYAGCIFLRTEYNNEITIQLILAKNRVAPIKEITLPRLELMAALIATRLYVQVKEGDFMKDISSFDLYCWTDSSVVLAWIKGKDQWKPFVQNRVKEILTYTNPENWQHLPGHCNPADLPSRGCNAKILYESVWWEGPSWLKLPSDNWPKSNVNIDEDLVFLERKKVSTTCLESIEVKFSTNLQYFSKYSKINRLVGWIFRFYNNCKNVNKLYDDLNFDELKFAETKIFNLIQAEENNDLSTKKIRFNYFIDNEGLMRIKTKLSLSEDEDTFKYPIYLRGSNEIVKRLVHQTHVEYKHAGAQMLMNILREKYWIDGIRKLVKKTIYNCIICKRYSVKSGQTPFAPLPLNRIKCGKAFEVTGVDLAGPFILRTNEKSWVVLFTCAVYRAVHLELINSLSTETFIMALRRFISRRGRVREIYSDNGTNFVGANNYFKEIDWNIVSSHSSIVRIKWNFNPPSSPWWGGWWERLVRIIKDLLRRTLGKASVNFIELMTILCDCEAIINSRPLTYIDNNSDNLSPLSPALFLQSIDVSDVTDIDYLDSQNLNVRIKYIQKLRSDFRQRFRSEYLSNLVHLGKERLNPISVGDIVLVEAETKRVNWPLGLILEIYKGVDGHARVARLKTANGERTRPFQKLYPLEVQSSGVDNIIDVNKPDITKSVTPQPMPVQSVTTRFGRQVKVPERYLS